MNSYSSCLRRLAGRYCIKILFWRNSKAGLWSWDGLLGEEIEEMCSRSYLINFWLRQGMVFGTRQMPSVEN